MKVHVFCGVEGLLDQAVATRLLQEVGGFPAGFYGLKGKEHLLGRLKSYNVAAQHFPWFVLVDLDDDPRCVPAAHRHWLPQCHPQMCFRIVVRQVEAWLLADREAAADFLRVPLAMVPTSPESLLNAKRSFVELAKRSGLSQIRQDLVPRAESGRATGPAYVPILSQFVSARWRPSKAARKAQSLRRCLDRLQALYANGPSTP